MKKIFSRIFLAVCVVTGGILLSKPADAQLLFGISFDAAGDVKSTIQQVEQYLTTIQEEVVAEVKKAWLKKHLGSVQFDEINIVKYGTPKSLFCESENDILFDDEEQNRKNWNGKAYNVENILEVLKAI